MERLLRQDSLVYYKSRLYFCHTGHVSRSNCRCLMWHNDGTMLNNRTLDTLAATFMPTEKIGRATFASVTA